MKKTGITLQLLTLGVGLTVAFLATDCKEDSPTSPTFTPTTTTTSIAPEIPAQVNATLGEFKVTIESISPPRGRASFPATISETAGTAVNVNFIRMETRWTGRADFGQDRGADWIRENYGTNRIAGNGTLTMRPWFLVPLQPDITGMRVTIGMTDIYGNDKTEVKVSGSYEIAMYNKIARSVGGM